MSARANANGAVNVGAYPRGILTPGEILLLVDKNGPRVWGLAQSLSVVGVQFVRATLSVIFLGAALAAAACSPSPPAEKVDAPAQATAPAAAAPEGETLTLEIVDSEGAALSGDTARGQRVFAQCRTCHALEAGVNRTGPSLHGLIGRRSGSAEGFRFSDANRNADVTWTEQALFDYLENPRRYLPGTTMAFAGIRNVQQRADVIAYLKVNTQ